MFSCGLLDRPCWAELRYVRILAGRGRGVELWLLKVQENESLIIPIPASQIDKSAHVFLYE